MAGQRRKKAAAARSSIKRKLVTVVLVAVAVTAAISTAASAWREATRYADAKIAELTGTAHVIANALAAPLSERDRMGVIKALRPIGRIPAFTHAAVATPDGAHFADLGLSVVLKEDPDRWILLRSSVEVSVPIMSSGSEIGSLTVLVNTKDLRQRLIDGALTGLLAAFIAAALGVIIATRLQRRITAPLSHLTDRMLDIQRTSDFSARVEARSNDETGVLVNAFNGMLDEIRERDTRLSDHRKNLENTVEERTQHLRIAKEDAEHANAAKSEFLATMSHEIRTPMNGMLVMAELLASANLTERHRHYSDVIVKSGQSLLTIINDILDFSKIEAGKLDLESVPLDPAEIVDDVLSLFWERAASKGLDLAAYVAPGVPAKIAGDPVRLNQVLCNLVNNALKFTETGHVRVVVELGDDGTAIKFTVIDSGIGIASDKLAHIFESFSQADQSTTRKFGGTGLGLAICRRLVEAMGGEIGVESDEGKGSQFRFAIKAAVVEPATTYESGALQRAIIAMPETASATALAGYLRDAGLDARLIPADWIEQQSLAKHDLLFAESDTIRQMAASGENENGSANPYVICVTQIGDTKADDVISSGQAHDMLNRPVSRTAFAELMARLAAGAPRGMAALKPKQGKTLPSLPGIKVLVADDSPVNREVIIEALKQLDVSADIVENGIEALEAASSTRYDVILMDCSMPEMDGFEATRAIRARERQSGHPAVPVIALTAHVAGAGADEWKSAGMTGYMTKPFRIIDLAECLQENYSGDPATAEPAEANSNDANPEAPESAALALDVKPASEATPTDRSVGLSEMPVIDVSVIETALAGNGIDTSPVIDRVLTIFESSAPPALLALGEAARVGDGVQIAKAAHALKSMSVNIGAKRLGAACSALEKSAHAGEAGNLPQDLSALLKLLTEVLEEVAAIRSRTGAGQSSGTARSR